MVVVIFLYIQQSNHSVEMFVQAIINLIQKDKLQTKKKALTDRERHEKEKKMKEKKKKKKKGRREEENSKMIFRLHSWFNRPLSSPLLSCFF